MALRRAVYRNGVATLLRRSVTATNAIQRSLSNYFPIDEHIYGVTEEQKQVVTHISSLFTIAILLLLFFCDYPVALGRYI